MPKQTFLVEPYEIIKFAIINLKYSDENARNSIGYVRPQYEVMTKTFTQKKIANEIDELLEDGETEDSLAIKGYNIVSEFLKHHKVTECTMTQ